MLGALGVETLLAADMKLVTLANVLATALGNGISWQVCCEMCNKQQQQKRQQQKIAKLSKLRRANSFCGWAMGEGKAAIGFIKTFHNVASF